MIWNACTSAYGYVLWPKWPDFLLAGPEFSLTKTCKFERKIRYFIWQFENSSASVCNLDTLKRGCARSYYSHFFFCYASAVSTSIWTHKTHDLTVSQCFFPLHSSPCEPRASDRPIIFWSLHLDFMCANQHPPNILAASSAWPVLERVLLMLYPPLPVSTAPLLFETST